jgi:hypothetical protein
MTPAEVDQLEDDEYHAFVEHMVNEAREQKRQTRRR